MATRVVKYRSAWNVYYFLPNGHPVFCAADPQHLERNNLGSVFTVLFLAK